MNNVEAPSFLQPYLEEASQWLKREKTVLDVVFSEATYQVLISEPDSHEELWCFLQFDAKDHLRDCFCVCEQNDLSGGGCTHLAAAWLRIFHNTALPLHKRFAKSLWHALCYLYHDKLGDRAAVLQRLHDEYVAFSAGKKRLCSLKPLTVEGREQLKAILFEREVPTEETSIKFSNLNPEQLLLWRTGRPSQELRYELSFWSDLAKWLFWLQEEQKDYIFQITPLESLPNNIEVTFSSIAVQFYISQANLPAIIPALGSVDSPLKVVDERQQGIDSLIYHESERALEIVPRALNQSQIPEGGASNAFDSGEWRYFPKIGFFAIAPHALLQKRWLYGDEIDALLSEHTLLVQELLVGLTLNSEPVTVSYKLEMDGGWNLHISCYVLEQGDLQESGSALFGRWAFLSGDGFYRVEGVYFTQIKLEIHSEDLPYFIAHHKSWLNLQQGFQIHVSSFEEQLTYTLDENNNLSFHQQPQPVFEGRQQHNFEPWLYVVGEGFYYKAAPIVGRGISPGIVVKAEQLPLFIRMHAEELMLIKGFFAERCPILAAKLVFRAVSTADSEAVSIEPLFVFQSGYREEDVKFFSEYVYVEGEGFSELPSRARLPEEYRSPTLLGGEEFENFVIYKFAELRPLAAEIDDALQLTEKLSLQIDAMAEDEKCRGWFILSLFYKSDKGRLSVYDIWEGIQKKKRFLCTAAGLLDLNSETFQWLRPLSRQRFTSPQALRLTSLELIRLQALSDSVQPKAGSVKEKLHRLLDFHESHPPLLRELNSELRPYQLMGYQWLWSLYERGLSGLLCDDMGLGKTHQAMALLDAVLHKSQGLALIVCPTSVLYHWQEKLQNYLPNIPLYVFYGSNRKLSFDDGRAGILLTSYGVVRSESERLASLVFTVAIFDEIQAAKNHRSRIHAALIPLQATMRLGLTGTPIENHLRELKALFDLTLPTYLPGERDFREYFIKPIEKEGDVKRRELLVKLVKPFILRRKKEDVLLDLPPKIEEVVHCALLSNQVHLYNTLLERSRSTLLPTLEKEGEPVPYMHIFSILSALKQICNHPAAYLKDPKAYKHHPSGKWNLFLELMHEARHSGQKVIVFSHYLAMLAIMQEYLTEEGIGFALLQGDTRDRASVVRRFQQDPDCEIFLGSLQAAGTGIDLTAANVVIHYDRWWNAAKERQATDRAYRIGQLRGVQVFKLVTKDTFEERIDAMIAAKAALSDEVIRADDHQILKQFDRHEILELLKQVPSTTETLSQSDES